MSVYGSYPPSSGYDYSAPTSVAVPPPPNENNYYQLPDVHYQGATTAVNRYHQQDVYYNDKVIVEDHIIWQPIHQRVYKYVPPTVTQGPVRTWTEGQEPPTPTPQINAVGGSVQLPYQGPHGIANNPQHLLSTLWSTLTSLINLLQQWAGGY